MTYLVIKQNDAAAETIIPETSAQFDSVAIAGNYAAHKAKENRATYKIYKLVEVAIYGPNTPRR